MNSVPRCDIIPRNYCDIGIYIRGSQGIMDRKILFSKGVLPVHGALREPVRVLSGASDPIDQSISMELSARGQEDVYR